MYVDIVTDIEDNKVLASLEHLLGENRTNVIKYINSFEELEDGYMKVCTGVAIKETVTHRDVRLIRNGRLIAMGCAEAFEIMQNSSASRHIHDKEFNLVGFYCNKADTEQRFTSHFFTNLKTLQILLLTANGLKAENTKVAFKYSTRKLSDMSMLSYVEGTNVVNSGVCVEKFCSDVANLLIVYWVGNIIDVVSMVSGKIPDSAYTTSDQDIEIVSRSVPYVEYCLKGV